MVFERTDAGFRRLRYYFTCRPSRACDGRGSGFPVRRGAAFCVVTAFRPQAATVGYRSIWPPAAMRAWFAHRHEDIKDIGRCCCAIIHRHEEAAPVAERA